MIYIHDQDKQNIHPNILNNQKKVQFSDKLKRYNNDTLVFSSDNSLQTTQSKENYPKKVLIQNQSTLEQSKCQPHQPEVSHFDLDELQNLSKQISLKDVSRINSKRECLSKNKMKKHWVKSIMQPSKAECKLLQKIQNMLEKQSFKPIYSTISRIRKQCHSNTMTSQEKLISQNISKVNSIVQNSKSSSPQSNNKSSLSDLINLSRLSGLSSKTLEKYLLCLEKEKINQMQKSHKVSEFSLIDTQRSKQAKMGHSSQKSKDRDSKQTQNEKKLIIEIYFMIKDWSKNKYDPQTLDCEKMLKQIKEFIIEKCSKNQTLIKQQDSTCLLED